MENPYERFARLAEKRANKILDGYRLLANLKGGYYKSTQAQRNELIKVLQDGLFELEACLSGDKPDKKKFKFESMFVSADQDVEPLVKRD